MTGVFDRAAATFDTTGPALFQVAGDWLVRAAGIAAGWRVLDVGAGTGAVTLPAARAVGPTGRVDAVDAVPAMLARLRAAADQAGLTNVQLIEGDAAEPPRAAGGYQAVTAGFVLFLLDDPTTAVRRYAELLVPGGRLALSTFGEPDSRWHWLLRLHLLAIRAGARPPGGGAKLTELLRAGGFDVTSVERRLRLVFDGPEDWWDWSWSHGQRALWEALPAPDRARVRDFAFNRIGAMAERDGRVGMDIGIRLTVGKLPSGGEEST